jgi:hypothetical protein
MARQYRDGVSAPCAGSVDPDHHVGSLDHRISRLAGDQFQLVDGLVGDRSGDDGAADVDENMGRGGSLLTSTIFPLRTLRALSFMTVSILVAA